MVYYQGLHGYKPPKYRFWSDIYNNRGERVKRLPDLEDGPPEIQDTPEEAIRYGINATELWILHHPSN